MVAPGISAFRIALMGWAIAMLACSVCAAEPLALVRGYPVVSIVVEGAGQEPFLLDTCIRQPVLDTAFAEKLGLERNPLSPEREDTAWWAATGKLVIEGIPPHTQTALVADLTPLQRKLGADIAGMLPAYQPGYEVSLNFAGGAAIWRPLDKAQAQFANDMTFAVKFDGAGKPQVELALEGRRCTCLVDSAMPDWLVMPAETLTPLPETRQETLAENGVSLEEVRLGNLQIGKWTIHGPVARLEAGPLRLGTGFLSCFRVTLNYEFALLRLEVAGPNEFDAPIRNGFGLAPAYASNGAWVLSVVSDSPAARAGIAPGDRLTAIEGIPISQMSVQTLEENLHAAEGQVRNFTIERNGVSTIVSLAAARIF